MVPPQTPVKIRIFLGKILGGTVVPPGPPWRKPCGRWLLSPGFELTKNRTDIFFRDEV